jgi:single-strand DNA-binding protein
MDKMNNVNLIGNLTKKPELRYTKSNKAYTKFTVAVNGYNEHVDFISCVAWEKLAENLCKFQDKGCKLGISGSIQTGSYDNEHGNKVYTTDILARNIEFLTPRQQSTEQKQAYNDIHKQEPQVDVSEDDLPF